MSLNHGALRRIYELDRMIRLGKLASARQAARDLEVSARTIERDLELLRYDLGAELVYNNEERHYEYSGKPFTLPAQWLTEKEIAILLIAERALRIFTSTSFEAEIHPAFNRLLNPIRHDRKAIEYIHDLCNSVHFHRPVEPIRDVRREFTIVLDAIMQRKRLSMVYHTSGKRTGERRELDPYVLINSGGEWYVVGFCRKSKSERTFVLGHIHEPAILDHYFDVPESFSVRRYLGEGFGRMHGGEDAREIELVVSPPAAGWVGRSRWHSSQQTREMGSGVIGLTLECPITDSLVRWVLQMGECVEVKRPEPLRRLVVEKARALVAANAEPAAGRTPEVSSSETAMGGKS